MSLKTLNSSSPKWCWMMDWCKKQGLAPSVDTFWKDAEKAFNQAHPPAKTYTTENGVVEFLD